MLRRADRKGFGIAVARGRATERLSGRKGSGISFVRAMRHATERLSNANEGNASYLPDATPEVDSQLSGEAGQG